MLREEIQSRADETIAEAGMYRRSKPIGGNRIYDLIAVVSVPNDHICLECVAGPLETVIPERETCILCGNGSDRVHTCLLRCQRV